MNDEKDGISVLRNNVGHLHEAIKKTLEKHRIGTPSVDQICELLA